MFYRVKPHAALLVSAAFVFVSNALAQAPIVDASVDSGSSPRGQQQANANSPPPPLDSGMNQGELFYQLQLLQQEVMQLRGQVEEQAHQLQQLKEQNMERYIDLDQRIGALGSGQGTPASSSGGDKQVTQAPVSAVPALKGEKDAYDKAYSLVISKQFDGALDAFKQFLVDYPNGKYAPNSYYWMGELYQVVTPANLEAARDVFTQLLSQYPDHAKAPDAMYKLGKVYFLLGNKPASREWLEKTINKYANTGNASSADKARQFLNANF